MNSALAVAIGLTLAIILILKKCLPVYALILGAIVSGLLSGWGFDLTVKEMFSGVKDISPAIVRILAAGVLTGVLVKTGAADKIALTIVKKAGRRNVFLALALSVFILTGVGVFIDVAVITVAPIAIMIGKEMGLSKGKVLLAMIGGGKCGNIVSPNPNTIVAAENFDAPLSSVMAAGIVPALVGLAALIFIILPMLPDKGFSDMKDAEATSARTDLPSFMASITGPLVAVLLMVLRPLFGIAIDPAIALPVGGLAGVIATRKWKSTGESMSYGLEKMSSIAVLLVGTGTIAGVIKASAVKDLLISLISGWEGGAALIAPVSSILMSAASASTTAGATIASASFAQTVLAAGVNAVWAAAMTNAGATVLDHLPHGSFFHATGGSIGMELKERLRLIPYESLIGLVLVSMTVVMMLIIN
mgnify:FL=1